MSNQNPSVPRGVEVLVKKAAIDPEFRAALLAKRAAAADEIGLILTPAEAAMLNAVPARQLELIIGQTHVDPAVRPAFLGKVAAAMLLALGVMTLGVNEGEAQSKGMLPDRPPSPPTANQPADLPTILGIQPIQPPTSQPASAERIDKLVAQLDDDNRYAVREAAERELRQLDMTTVVNRLKEIAEKKNLSPGAANLVDSLIAAPAEIERLVRQLEFQIMARRGATIHHDTTPDEAEARLIEIGPWALPVVKAAVESGKLSADAAARATRIIAKLQAAAPATQPTSRVEVELPSGIRPGEFKDAEPAQPAAKGHWLVIDGQWQFVAGDAPVAQPMQQEVAGARADQPLLPPQPRPVPPVATSQPTSQPAALEPGEFEKLVTQLDDPKFPVREAAEQRLFEAGKPILPLLRKAKENKDLPPEAIWRVRRVIDRLSPPPPPVRDPRVPRAIRGLQRELIDGLRADPPGDD